MKKNVAVVYGGNSDEWDISVKSGKNVAAALDRNKYNVYEILYRKDEWGLSDPSFEEAHVVGPVDTSDFSCTVEGTKVKFDIALVMIHGTPGEDGILQRYFEKLGVPCSTCSSKVLATIFDKHDCKVAMKDLGVPMAKDVFLAPGDKYSVDAIVEKLSLPVFVKPCDGGSSYGVTKVKEVSHLEEAIRFAFATGKTVLIEQAIEGREMSEGVFSAGGKIITLPVTEIVPHNEYFDYEAKYLGKSDEICPARISEEESERISDCTAAIYRHFGCTGLIRIDYILDKEGTPYFLEVNTVPGMTNASIVPVQLRTAGLELSDVMDAMLSELK